MKEFATSVASTALSGGYLVGLFFAVMTDEPWLYHPLAALLLLLPAVSCTVFSVRGRTANPNNAVGRVSNVIGAAGYFTTGFLLLVCYGWLISSK